MFKKLSLLLAAAGLASAALPAQELFDNGNLDGKPPVIISGWASGHAKATVFTEDKSWNRCLKIELLNIDPKRAINLYPYLGRTRNQAGVVLKPDTTYDISLEIKGTMPYCNLAVIEFFTDQPYYKEGKDLTKRTYSKFRSVKPTGEWSRYSWSFRTDKRTKRLAIVVSSFATGKRKDDWKVGDYLLLDNLSIKESKSVIKTDAKKGDKAAASVPEIPVPVVFAPSKKNFLQHNIAYWIERDAEAVTVKVELPPGKSKKLIKENGSKVWQDDVAEIFFGPVKGDRLMSQFVVASGGGRHSTNGSRGTFDPASWSGTVKDRVVTFRIPYKTLGYDKAPAPGDHILFNIGVQSAGRISYLPPLNKTNFRDIEHFNTLIFGTLSDHLKKHLPAKASEFAKFPADIAVGKMRAELQRMELARFAGLPFLTAHLHPTRDFTAPLVVEQSEVISKTIELKGLLGETVAMPIAILNRTGRTENYRVVVRSDDLTLRVDRTGLSNNFPPEDIVMREAVAVKMSDAENAPQVFDPLVLMNQGQTVTAAPGEAAVVWVQFKCRKPGKYTGLLRVIPLSESSSYRKFNAYKGKMQDHKIALEVLDIKLPRPAEGFDSLYHSPDLFQQQQASLPGPVMSGAWRRYFRYDEKGNLLGLKDPDALKKLQEVVDQYKTLPDPSKLKLFLSYNEYRVFEINLNKKIKPRSPESYVAWRNHLKATAKLMQDLGLDYDEYEIEIWDEPNAKNMEHLLKVCKIARETLPKANLLITWGPSGFGYTAEKIRKFLPYINCHLFHEYLLGSSEIQKLMQEIRQDPRQKLGFYVCSVKMESLHRYYRLFGWRGMAIGAKRWHFYSVIESLWGPTGERSWKAAAGNSVFMDANGSAVPTIRGEALRLGFADTGYLALLKDPEKIRKIAHRVCNERSFDSTEPDKLREAVLKEVLKK